MHWLQVSSLDCLGTPVDWLLVWTPLFLNPSDGVFGRFDLAALLRLRHLQLSFVCLVACWCQDRGSWNAWEYSECICAGIGETFRIAPLQIAVEIMCITAELPPDVGNHSCVQSAHFSFLSPVIAEHAVSHLLLCSALICIPLMCSAMRCIPLMHIPLLCIACDFHCIVVSPLQLMVLWS